MQENKDKQWKNGAGRSAAGRSAAADEGLLIAGVLVSYSGNQTHRSVFLNSASGCETFKFNQRSFTKSKTN